MKAPCTMCKGSGHDKGSRPKVQYTDYIDDEGKSKAAVELGRKGGAARAKKLSPERRREIARQAARLRWAAKSD